MEFVDQEWVKVVGSILGVMGVVILKSLLSNAGKLLDIARQHVSGSQYKTSLTHAIDVIESVSTIVEHTVLPELLEASKDGKLTQEEIESIVTHAKDEIAKLIDKDKESLLNDFLGDYQTWMDTKVRAAVLAMANKVAPTAEIILTEQK